MPRTVQCPSCDNTFQSPNALSQVMCPGCGKMFRVGRPTPGGPPRREDRPASGEDEDADRPRRRQARPRRQAQGLSAPWIMGLALASVVGLVGLVAGTVGVIWALNAMSSAAGQAGLPAAGRDALPEAVAEADRLDPGWRLEELEGKRPTVPAATNSAPRVLDAARALPGRWPDESLDHLAQDVEPSVPLNETQARALRAELQTRSAALRDARSLTDLPRGRYQVAWTADALSTPMPHVSEAHKVAKLLLLDALLRAQDREPDEALASCRAALNGGRSVGDEPATISQLARCGWHIRTVKAVERTLAQGQPAEGALSTTQQLLEDVAADRLLLTAARAERAFLHRVYEALAAGTINLPPGAAADSLVRDPTLRQPDVLNQGHAWVLHFTTQFVEIAKEPPEKQLPKIRQLEATRQDAPPAARPLVPAVEKIAGACLRTLAQLRCASVALALERYRQAQGRWPEELTALKPAYLREVPGDPFAGAPLRYRRLGDGVVVYSVGLDGTDDGGTLDDKDALRNGVDLGVRLWDASHRRHSPR